MDNSALVKYYDPRTGKYEFATVLDVGDLSKLNTTIKTDLVSAINSLEGNGWGGGGEVPPELIDELENIKDAIASIKDGTFIIEEWGSFDQYFQSGIADAIEQLNIFNREQIVITVEEIEAAIQESKDYYDQHLAETMQDVESARTDMANAQQTLNETAQRLEEADLNYSEVTLKVDEIDQYIEGNIKSVKFDIVNAVVTEYESLVRQVEDEFGVNVEESFLSYLTGRVGKAEADISVQSGKIESKVGYDEFQYMPVEDIDQYNKNLLFHTMDFSESWERNDVRAYITTDSFRHTRIVAMDISNAYYSSITDTLELGKTYTLSASFNIQPITKAPNEDRFAPTDGSYDVSAFIDGIEYPMVDLVENLTGINGFKRLSVSFVSENENPEVYFRIKNLNAETSTGYMTAPKLEAGNKSTPWQPHFDDEYATMLSTNSLVRQQGNEIVSLISSNKELGDKFVTATSSFQQLEDGFIRNAELIEEYEDAVVRYGMEVEELNDRITQKVWIDDFSDAVESISIDGKNRVLNSDFVDMSTDNNQLVLGSWENVDPLFTIEKIDGVNYAVIKRTGLTGNIVASMASNRFAVKNGERLMFGFDIIVEAMPDVGNVFQIELLDINDIRVGLESFTLDQMDGDITLGEASRLNYQYIINREDVAKARVRLMLTRNGHVKFTRVMAQQGTIKDTEWSPAPEDAQILRMKMQTEINQTAEKIQLLANDERLDAINDILYRKEGKLEVSPTEILARVTSAELGEDAVVTGTQLKLTDEALRFDLVGKDGLIQSINASEEELKIDFDRVEVNGMLIAKILSTEYLDVSQGFKIMNGSHMVLGISPNNDFIIDADRILINSNQVLTTEDKDEINKKIDESWIYQDPEGVIIGAVSQELEKSKTDPLSAFSEMWSNITVNAEGIEAAVSKDGVIQSINLSNEEALIDFDKVRITGELLATLISSEKIDVTDNFGIYYQDRLVFGVDAPTQTIHINSNNIMVNGKRVAIIDDVLTVDGKVIDLTGRVDGHDTQLSNIAQQVLAAIAEAEAAKKAAQKSYEDAVAEAEAKVQAKDEEYKLIFEEYDSTVEAIEADTQTAKTKADQALIDVGISTDLAQTAKDLATTAQTNASTAISNASQAISDASGAVSQALSAFNLATSAKSDVSTISSDVDELAGQVSLKANQTVVDQLSGTVNNHTAYISANAQAIQARLTSAQVNTLVDGKGFSTVNYVDNQISATADGIGVELNKLSDLSIKNKFSDRYFKNGLGGWVSDHEDVTIMHGDNNMRIVVLASNSSGKRIYNAMDGFENGRVFHFSFTLSGLSNGIIRVGQGGVNGETIEFQRINGSVNCTGTFLSNGYALSIYFPDSGTMEIRNMLVYETSGVTTLDMTRVNVRADGLDLAITNLNSNLSNNYATKTYANTQIDIKAGEINQSLSAIEGRLDANLIDLVKLASDKITNDNNPTIWSYVFNGKPNTTYTLSTNVPAKGTFYDLFMDRSSLNPSSASNGLGKDKPKTLTTDSTGLLTIGIRKDTEEALGYTTLKDILGGRYWIILAQGSQARTFEDSFASVKVNELSTTVDGWRNTISYVSDNRTKINETISSVDSYKQTIGTNGEKIAQMVMTDSIFQNTISDFSRAKQLITNGNFANGMAEWVFDGTATYVLNSDKTLSLNYANIDGESRIYNNSFRVVQGVTYTLKIRARTLSTATIKVGPSGATADIVLSQDFKTYSVSVAHPSIAYVISIYKANREGTVIIDYIELYEEGGVTTSQVAQLAGSWALTLKSGNDIKTQINASTDSIRLSSKFTHLSGTSLIDDAVIKSAHIETLNANKITGNTADFNTIRAGVLTANAVTSTHISADNALIDKLFATSALIERLTSKTAFISQLKTIDLVADKASFVQAGWQGLNSNVTVDSSKIRLTNSAKDFIEMNGIPELRSQDNVGTAAIFGKGRSHYYSGSQARFYIGSNLEGLAQYGIHIAKGQTWGIYRNSDSYGGTPAQYHVVKSGESWRSITNLYWDGNTSINVLLQLNGYNINNFPVLQPNDTILIKAAVAGNQSGVEKVWTMGTSSNGSTRVYSHVYHVFEAGTSLSSDRRIKHDIEETKVKALDHIESLAFKQYRMNRDNRLIELGLIAQDSGILRVRDDETEGIDLQGSIMLALKAIQELQEEIKLLKGA